ncbi:hypothetical protein HPP92_014169 [Vanilla planifolia]|uniref:Sialate O-acetylesterase domain-containing protein n=1 Tax=Vanilla planifolia TaxID=51239 RepID=A0A835QGC2_VANPL|nr:hypothetical protein HPP92_014602 [Vanilla planifolia]KAG0474483.1 hypothetical protein HPP92_014169 [Vanilla planifolia]
MQRKATNQTSFTSFPRLCRRCRRSDDKVGSSSWPGQVTCLYGGVSDIGGNTLSRRCRHSPTIAGLALPQVANGSRASHADIDFRKTCGVGPRYAVASIVAASRLRVLGLVPCAVGVQIRESGPRDVLYKTLCSGRV